MELMEGRELPGVEALLDSAVAADGGGADLGGGEGSPDG
jgi:hypothetical protein